MRLTTIIVLVLLLLSAVPTAAQHLPALVSGQSNAKNLSAWLPPASHVLVARGGTSILAWDWTHPDGDLGRQLRDALRSHTFSVFVWWQGETDGLQGMSAEEYADRLLAVLLRVQERHTTPILIVEMADHPSRMHLKAVQARFAAHPLVALIETSDLPMQPGNAHDFDGPAYRAVAERLMACYFTECWLRQ